METLESHRNFFAHLVASAAGAAKTDRRLRDHSARKIRRPRTVESFRRWHVNRYPYERPRISLSRRGRLPSRRPPHQQRPAGAARHLPGGSKHSAGGKKSCTSALAPDITPPYSLNSPAQPARWKPTKSKRISPSAPGKIWPISAMSPCTCATPPKGHSRKRT